MSEKGTMRNLVARALWEHSPPFIGCDWDEWEADDEDKQFFMGQADAVLEALGVIEGLAFAPVGIATGIGILLDAPLTPKVKAGTTVYLVAPSQFARRTKDHAVHACLVCAPDPSTPGPGCINCRQTGYDQTPCVGCPRASLSARPTTEETGK